MAVAALLHLLDLLLLQLGLLRHPLNNPHEVPPRRLTLQPTPSNLVLPLNRARALAFSDRWLLQLRELNPLLSFISLPFFNFQLVYDFTYYIIIEHKADIMIVVWQWARVSAMPLEECLEGLAPQLSNNKRTALLLAKPTRAALKATCGVLEAVRRTQKPLPSVSTRTKATCRSVAGIWINW